MRLTARLLLASPLAALEAPELHLDLLSGGSAQLNPTTEYRYPRLSGFPPALEMAKRPFYASETGQRLDADARLLLDWGLGEAELKADLAFQSMKHSGALPDALPEVLPPHRSRGLLRDARAPDGAWTAVFDQLYLRLPLGGWELSLGRQPLNFATNHSFAPNDILSAFAPNDLLRLYRPGQDALRLTCDLSPLAQAEVVALAGYDTGPPPAAAPGLAQSSPREIPERFAPEFDKRKAGLLGRLHADTGVLAVGTLFGWQASRELAGLSLQFDLGQSWMLGFEGNLSRWDDDPGRAWPDASLGLSWQATPSLAARTEFASSPSFPLCPFCARLEREQRSLNALGLNWDSEGLWKLGAVNLSDLDRWEGLLALSLQYSLASESDLILGAQFPWRLPKDRPSSATAFELAPLSGSLHLRWFL